MDVILQLHNHDPIDYFYVGDAPTSEGKVSYDQKSYLPQQAGFVHGSLLAPMKNPFRLPNGRLRC